MFLYFDLDVHRDVCPAKAPHNLLPIPNTVDSRYLEIGYLKFCATQSVYLNQKYILLLSLTTIWRWILFYKSKLPEVQINLHFG